MITIRSFQWIVTSEFILTDTRLPSTHLFITENYESLQITVTTVTSIIIQWLVTS